MFYQSVNFHQFILLILHLNWAKAKELIKTSKGITTSKEGNIFLYNGYVKTFLNMYVVLFGAKLKNIQPTVP